MKTVIGLFDSFDDARNVVDELVESGFQRGDVRLENSSKGEHAFEADEGHEHAGSGLIGGLRGAGVPRQDAETFAEGVRRGGTVLILSCQDRDALRAYDIMARHGSIDMDERSEIWRQGGWSGFGEITAGEGTRALEDGEAVLPVIEESLQIGKREVTRGGVRAYTRVLERPVEEEVHLHEEHVHVERRATDRPVSEADRMLFKETSIEVRELAEEVIITKRPRIVEEVIIAKEAFDRVETVRDTVRRTEVEIERLDGSELESSEARAKSSGEPAPVLAGPRRFEDFDKEFRSHYKSSFSSSGGSYEDYLPIYRYGYSLGTDNRFSSGEWQTIEPEARRHWEERNPGTWEHYGDTVRYAWDRVRG
jgi:uncharacterized protein (TIGR02271 family)